MPHKTEDSRWSFGWQEFEEWAEKRPDQLGTYFGWNCLYCWREWKRDEKECAGCGAKRGKV